MPNWIVDVLNRLPVPENFSCSQFHWAAVRTMLLCALLWWCAGRTGVYPFLSGAQGSSPALDDDDKEGEEEGEADTAREPEGPPSPDGPEVGHNIAHYRPVLTPSLFWSVCELVGSVGCDTAEALAHPMSRVTRALGPAGKRAAQHNHEVCLVLGFQNFQAFTTNWPSLLTA